MSAAAGGPQFNPFPGLRPFREDEDHLFFGRENQVDAMVNKLAETRFLAVVGTSGSGKSSLVNCGLRPALRQGLMAKAGTAWRMAQLRPGNDPIGAMARALAQDGVLFREDAAAGLSLAEIIETTLRMSKVGLIDICEQAGLDAGVNLLVVVDQFEELFRYRQVGTVRRKAGGSIGDDAAAFVNLLLEVKARATCPIFIVLTMRSDFFGDCTQFPGLAEAINAGQYLVPRMTRDERRAAIEGPVGVGGAQIAPVLLTRLVNDVGDNPDQLSILQHALNRTWACWEEKGGKGPLDLLHYEAIGTMAHALDQHAEQAYAELDPRQQAICEKLFRALTDTTDPRGIRRPTTLGELCDLTGATAADVADVIAVFRDPSRSFLMPPAGEALRPESVIDISHESLMRVWKRLMKWAEEEARSARIYRRLADTADLYGQGNASLWRDPDLQLALDWREKNQPNETWAVRYHPGFAPAMRFLTESSEAREAERAERERQRQRELDAAREKADTQARNARRMLLAAAVCLVLAVLALLGLWRAHEASQIAATRQREAEEYSRIAETREKEAREASVIALTREQEAQRASRIAEARQKEAQESSRLAEARQKEAQESSRLAEEKRKEAQQYLSEAQMAQSRTLVSAADDSDDPTTRILLALEAVPDAKEKIERPVLFPALKTLTDGINAVRELAVARGHTEPINGVAVTPDGARIVTVSDDQTARVLDGKTGLELLQLKGHAAAVIGVAVMPGGGRIITASSDKTARVWDAGSGGELLRLQGHTNAVNSVAATPDATRIVTGSTDRTARVWDAATGAELLELKGHTGAVTSVAVTPDGTRIVTASADRTARVWDARTGAQLLELKGHSGIVRSVAVTPDGTRIVTGSADNTARVWDATTGAELLKLNSPTDAVTSVAVTSDGVRIVTGSSDGSARVWDARTGATLFQFKGHAETVTSVAVTPDGARVVTGSADRTLRIWDARTEVELLQLKGHTEGVIGVAAMPDGARIVTGSADKTARVWDARTGAELLQLKGHTGTVNAVAVTRDGGRIVTGSSDNTVRLWEASTGRELLQIKTHADETCAKLIAFLFPTRVVDKEREARLAGLLKSLDPTNTVPLVQIARLPQYADERKQLLDAAIRTNLIGAAAPASHPNRAPIATYCDPDIHAVAVTPDGARIVAASNDGSVRVWEAQSGAELLRLDGHTSRVTSVAVTPDGARIVSGSFDSTARIWDAKTGAPLLQLKGHTRPVWRVAVTPDGSRIVTGSSDNTARVWDAGTGAELLKLKGHTGGVSAIALTPDGSRIVTASADKTARVWDAQTAAELLRTGEIGQVNNVAVMPDGAHMVTVSLEGGSRLWDLAQLRPPPVQYQFSTAETRQALVDRAKVVVPRCLTIEQRKTFVLAPAPPDWCIEMGKHPYDTKYWKAWKAKNTAEAHDSTTGSAYGDFADAAIKAGDFRSALEAAKLGIIFSPELVWIRMNLAHAHMFLDHVQEARNEYLDPANRSAVIEQGKWEELVVKDFKEYREQGREHALMAEIEREFKPPLYVDPTE